MLNRCICAEWIKLRHSRIWMILISLPIISVLIGGANFLLNQGVLKEEWYSLWSQVGLFYGEFFLPILIAICCSYVCRLEHLNNNWKMVMTSPISPWTIFFSKLLVVSTLLIFVQFLFLLLYILTGILVGFTSKLPAELAGWLFRGWVATVMISALQLGLSIRIHSFAAPVGIGLCATFLGLGMYVADLGLFYPHSLLTIGMGVLSQEGLTLNSNILFYMMNIFYIFAISVISIHWMKRRAS